MLQPKTDISFGKGKYPEKKAMVFTLQAFKSLKSINLEKQEKLWKGQKRPDTNKDGEDNLPPG